MANQSQDHGQGSSRNPGRSGTQNRGFASMSEAEQREIARMGGEAVSENREHMAEIGRKGGEASAEARAAAALERANRKNAEAARLAGLGSGIREVGQEKLRTPTSVESYVPPSGSSSQATDRGSSGGDTSQK